MRRRHWADAYACADTGSSLILQQRLAANATDKHARRANERGADAAPSLAGQNAAGRNAPRIKNRSSGSARGQCELARLAQTACVSSYMQY